MFQQSAFVPSSLRDYRFSGLSSIFSTSRSFRNLDVHLDADNERDMAKRVKLVLREDIYKLGKNGDLVEVAPGYARNYLFPKGLAVPVTPGVMKQVERRREEERQRKIDDRNKAESTKTALATIGLLRVPKPVGEDDAIFGTVTNRELADVLKEFAGVEVDRADIEVPEISKLGKYEATVKLHAEVTATVNFEVVPD